MLKRAEITIVALCALLASAIVMAAFNKSAVAWFIAIVTAGWLVLAVIVVLLARKLQKSVQGFVGGNTPPGQSGPGAGGDPTVVPGHVVTPEDSPTGSGAAHNGDNARILELKHSLTVVTVQAESALQRLEKDPEKARMALETIAITAENAKEILQQGQAGR